MHLGNASCFANVFTAKTRLKKKKRIMFEPLRRPPWAKMTCVLYAAVNSG